jgi:ATP-dependent DNA ligase
MIKPMLAHKYDPQRATYPAYIQPKLDGVRCTISAKGAFSRTHKEFKNVDHIKKSLKAFFNEHPDAILDGELYNHDLRDDFEKIISLVRKTKPTDEHRKEARKLIQFHCYDIVSYNGEPIDWVYEYRREFLENHVSYKNFPIIRIVKANTVADHQEALNAHKYFLKQGYEGSIYRNRVGRYRSTRSYGLMKFKDFSDAEATIVGYELGKGKRTGTLGKFIMMDDDGIEFGCPPGKGYNYEDMTKMVRTIADYIGKRATFTYFERTKAGSYRHPHYKCLRNYE